MTDILAPTSSAERRTGLSDAPSYATPSHTRLCQSEITRPVQELSKKAAPREAKRKHLKISFVRPARLVNQRSETETETSGRKIRLARGREREQSEKEPRKERKRKMGDEKERGKIEGGKREKTRREGKDKEKRGREGKERERGK